MITGYFMFAVILAMDLFVYVAIDLYFESHPAFNDEIDDEKINNGTRTIGRLQQYDLF